MRSAEPWAPVRMSGCASFGRGATPARGSGVSRRTPLLTVRTGRGKAFYFSSVMFLYYSLLGLDFPKQLEDGAWKKIYTTLYVRWIGPYQYCEKNYPGTVGLYYNAFAKQEEESIALIQSFLTQRGKDLIEEVNKAAASSEEIREMFEKNKKWTLLLINLANLHQQTGLPIEEIPWDEKYKETLAWDDKAYCEGLSLHADFILGYNPINNLA